jgi:hypothetical protein
VSKGINASLSRAARLDVFFIYIEVSFLQGVDARGDAFRGAGGNGHGAALSLF